MSDLEDFRNLVQACISLEDHKLQTLLRVVQLMEEYEASQDPRFIVLSLGPVDEKFGERVKRFFGRETSRATGTVLTSDDEIKVEDRTRCSWTHPDGDQCENEGVVKIGNLWRSGKPVQGWLCEYHNATLDKEMKAQL